MRDTVRIRISVEFPDRPPIEAVLDVGPEQARQFLYPVPRNHDSPFAGRDAEVAREIRRQRLVLLPNIGNEFAKYITRALHEALQEADPVNGYDRKELR